MNVSNVIKRIERLGAEYERLIDGSRRTLYLLLQEAAIIAGSVEKFPKFRERLVVKLGQADRRDTLIPILASMMKPIEQGQVKLMSKYKIALRFLMDVKGVPVHEVADALQSLGGIECVAKHSAVHRAEVRRQRKTGGVSLMTRPKEPEELRQKDEEDDDDDDDTEMALSILVPTNLQNRLRFAIDGDEFRLIIQKCRGGPNRFRITSAKRVEGAYEDQAMNRLEVAALNE